MTLRSHLFPLSVILALGLAAPAFAEDTMGKGDGMSKTTTDSKMSSPMSKDGMGKDAMSHPDDKAGTTGMKKDGMSDTKSDGMKK
jgi:pentapeptide MXKDX repeat protein